MANVGVVGAIAAAYILIVLGIGELARRKTADDPEDYFMASRTFGTVVLFFALLATNMTAFIMIGIPGTIHSVSIGAYGWGAVFFLVFPVVFATVGYRLWLTGKKFGHITPGDLFNHRYDARHLGAGVMALMVFWTIPYILIGVQGGGEAFAGLTDGAIPFWVGALVVALVVFIYVNVGGMRGTGWANTFQGAVMIVFLWLLLVAVGFRLGGFVAASEATMAEAPEIADRLPVYDWQFYFSWIIVFGINIIMNPHMFQRILPGFSVETLRRVAVLYPVGLMLIWIPPSIIGFWGRGALPDIAEPDQILPALVGTQFGSVVVGLALAGLLAAIMSSIDAQTLSVANLAERDLFANYTDLTPRREVLFGRVFVGIILAVIYVLALLRVETLVRIGEVAFTGYALLFLPLMIGFYWRRANAAAAWAGLLFGFFGYWGFLLGVLPEALLFGFEPIVPLMIGQIILVGAIPYVTPQPPAERVQEYFELFDGVW